MIDLNIGVTFLAIKKFITTLTETLDLGLGEFLVWLIITAIQTAIISVIIAAIAHGIDKKNDFGEWFGGSFVVVGITQIILWIVIACV